MSSIVLAFREEIAALNGEPLEGASGVDVARRRADAFDTLVRGLFGRAGEDAGLALVALGGYGRAELAPGSDLDLMILHEPGAEREAEEAFAALLYPLWDTNLVLGHAVRTPRQCGAESRDRIESCTSLLDARLLAGPASLFEEALAEVRSGIDGDRLGFVHALRESRIVREARFGTVGESLEPDLKESLGGLRDVALLRWVARGILAPGEEWQDGLVRADLVRASDAAAALAAGDALLLARTALHRAAGRASSRLAADHQPTVAELLAVPAEPEWEPRDVLLRDLIVGCRRVAFAAERCLDRAEDELGGRRAHVVAVDWDRPAPEGLLRALAAVAEEGATLDGGDLDRAEAAGPALREACNRWPDGARSSFVRILASGEGGARALGLMDVLGLLTALVPEWTGVRGRAQRDPYHRFPVDAHLVRAAAHMARLLLRPDEPFAARALLSISDPLAPLLGALLHDIGKQGRGSHVEVGVGVAEAVLDRMGVEGAEREAVLFLVREHLLLSDTATRRDLEDPALVLDVAARVGDPDRLAMLYLLTLADAVSTGPAAATPWRLGLVRDLVARLGRAFEHGEMDRDRALRIEQAKAGVRQMLGGRDPAEVGRFLETVPPEYLLTVAPEDAAAHLALVSPRPGATEARTHHRPARTAGLHRLSVAALDRAGLLASIAGALTLAGLTVLSAQAFTTEDRIALDVFEVAGAFEEEVGEERWRRFRRTLRHALEGRVDVADRVRVLRAQYRPARADIPVRVKLDHDASSALTVVEVGAPDRLGLLFDLARTFADLHLHVHVAKVATYGPRVVDVFYVADARGEKLEKGRGSELERALLRAVAGTEEASS